ncbi:phage portal protein [Alcaligenaceae bacterium]|nr:phage portal protein [Alcaligenaceae bacterium]
MSETKTKKPGRVKSSVLKWLGVPISLTDGTFWSAFYGTDSYSGKSVTVNSALQLSTVWACVNLLSRTVSTLPLNLYRRTADGGREVANSHPLYALLHSQPNADMTASVFRQVILAHLLLWGNSFIEKTYSGKTIVALTPLLPAQVEKKRLKNGSFEYWYDDRKGRRRKVDERNMMHIPAFTMDGYIGLSVIGCARQIFGNAEAAEEAAGKTFANGMKSTGLVTMDAIMKPEQREEVRQHVKRVWDNGGVMVLEKGSEFQQLTMNPQDAELLSTRNFSVEEIARWFGVPPHMIGHTGNSTSWGTGLEQQVLGFLTFSMQPWLTLIEQQINKDLLHPEDRAEYYSEHVVEGLMRADSAGRAALYSSSSQNGWMSRKEIRSKENLPYKEGTDVLTVQSNLTPLDQLGQTSDATKARDAIKDWLNEGKTDET